RFKLRVRLRKSNLIRTRVDHEQQVAFVDDLAVLEVYLSQRASDLRAEFDVIHRRELAKADDLRVDGAPARFADRHLWGRDARLCGLATAAMRELGPRSSGGGGQ